MANDTSDEEIAATFRQAEELLTKLHLSAEERKWAKEQAKAAFAQVTDAYLTEANVNQLRALTVAAALAYALTTTKDWAAAVDEKIRHPKA